MGSGWQCNSPCSNVATLWLSNPLVAMYRTHFPPQPLATLSPGRAGDGAPAQGIATDRPTQRG